ncbi:methionine adenosyltransferase 2 subunit beta [Raphidocelis subcapitata]|uniref:Methionine adenosyltransferase 2 subunit beta n=1 Tax=Raphidocelis subcapitata TaxID=307507 RepID=A0A2V0PKT5_9CHLO|nr:methionine adenosyltransferase 2 subunit beta [Raphidocelis subcapitata]|eukprot:GBF98490.1 methionine adenosyltransferase 2 subunit beta [Raphidocelis subcapitata]
MRRRRPAWALGSVDAVINCAALSQPALCEQDYQLARAVNVPDKLIAALVRQRRTRHVEALLVHISTDQVYDGSHADWTETDRTAPINAYGRSKLEAEQYVRTHWERRIILRSSLIYGPQPPHPVGRPLFLQFVEEALREGRPTRFLEDEFRSAVYVKDICAVVSHLIKLLPDAPPHHTYNLGGPERLSRLDVARAVARHCGHGEKAIEAVTSSSMGDRGYNSPLDISMHVDRILTEIPVSLTPLSEALKEIFPAKVVAAAK